MWCEGALGFAWALSEKSKEVAKPLRDDCSQVRAASITVERAGHLYLMVGANR